MEFIRVFRCQYFPLFSDKWNLFCDQWPTPGILPWSNLQWFTRTELLVSGMSSISCKLKGRNIFSIKLDKQLNCFILFYWIKCPCPLYTAVSSWIVLSETRIRHFVNADVPYVCNPYQVQISFIADPLNGIAYIFSCKLQNNTVLEYSAHFVLTQIVFKLCSICPRIYWSPHIYSIAIIKCFIH